MDLAKKSELILNCDLEGEEEFDSIEETSDSEEIENTAIMTAPKPNASNTRLYKASENLGTISMVVLYNKIKTKLAA